MGDDDGEAAYRGAGVAGELLHHTHVGAGVEHVTDVLPRVCMDRGLVVLMQNLRT